MRTSISTACRLDARTPPSFRRAASRSCTLSNCTTNCIFLQYLAQDTFRSSLVSHQSVNRSTSAANYLKTVTLCATRRAALQSLAPIVGAVADALDARDRGRSAAGSVPAVATRFAAGAQRHLPGQQSAVVIIQNTRMCEELVRQCDRDLFPGGNPHEKGAPNWSPPCQDLPDEMTPNFIEVKQHLYYFYDDANHDENNHEIAPLFAWCFSRALSVGDTKSTDPSLITRRHHRRCISVPHPNFRSGGLAKLRVQAGRPHLKDGCEELCPMWASSKVESTIGRPTVAACFPTMPLLHRLL